MSDTREANPGEVWEEVEFWIELSWRIDPDGSLGIRKTFESPLPPGEKITVDELYGWMFENQCPACPRRRRRGPDAAGVHAQVRRVRATRRGGWPSYDRPLTTSELAEARWTRPPGWCTHPPRPPRRPNITPMPFFQPERGGAARGGATETRWWRASPRRREAGVLLATLRDWGWPEYAMPAYIRSHVHPDQVDRAANEAVLLSTFRLPTLIHTRSGNAKWLYEISHKNPVWIHASDAARLGVATGDLIKVTTEIGYFVDRVWVTEGIRPGVIACSHHLGRWRLQEGQGGSRFASALVTLTRRDGPVAEAPGQRRAAVCEQRPRLGAGLVAGRGRASEPDLRGPPRPGERDALLAPEGAAERVGAGDRYGDIYVDTVGRTRSIKSGWRWPARRRAAGGDLTGCCVPFARTRRRTVLLPFPRGCVRRVGVKDVPEASLGLLSRLWLREPDSLALAAARGLPSLAPHADEPAEMAPAYTDLFLLNVYPYGTAFIDPSGELNGPAAWQSRATLREPGLSPAGTFRSWRARSRRPLPGISRTSRKRRAGGPRVLFLSPGVGPDLLSCRRTGALRPSLLLRAVAAATRRRLMEDIPESVSQASEPEESAPQSTHPEEEEVGLSHIVRFLLAPARSGLFLSRARLGQLARAAGMRLPFGSRFDVARMLYQTAGEGGKVGTVLDLLGAELAVWEAAYRAWAEEHRRWAPLAARWLHRTGETGRMIAQMRKILENPPELEYTDGRSGEGSA